MITEYNQIKAISRLGVSEFPVFKLLLGSLFLFATLFVVPSPQFLFVAALVVSRVHGLGTWLAMWRSGKLNWTYMCWMCILTYISYLLCFTLVFKVAVSITCLLFLFHFVYDEIDLHMEKHTLNNSLKILLPYILSSLYIIDHIFSLNLPVMIYVIIVLLFFAVEVLYLRQISIFNLQTMILTLYILILIVMGYTGLFLFNVFLAYHYLFWFIYPVYKLHLFKPGERDGLIIILVLLGVTALFFSGFNFMQSYSHNDMEMVYRSFYAVTIIHILSTPPFGYIFGLKKPNEKM